MDVPKCEVNARTRKVKDVGEVVRASEDPCVQMSGPMVRERDVHKHSAVQQVD